MPSGILPCWVSAQTSDLFLSGGMLLAFTLCIGLILRTQMLITLKEPLAIASRSIHFASSHHIHSAAGIGGGDFQ